MRLDRGGVGVAKNRKKTLIFGQKPLILDPKTTILGHSNTSRMGQECQAFRQALHQDVGLCFHNLGGVFIVPKSALTVVAVPTDEVQGNNQFQRPQISKSTKPPNQNRLSLLTRRITIDNLRYSETKTPKIL